MIKYLGSKRRLVPVLEAIAAAVRPRTALDLFTGTTRVAQAFKRLGAHVTAVDSARYAEVLAECFVATDAGAIDRAALSAALAHLDALPGEAGYVTETFCRDARFFTPENGMRIDAIRTAIDAEYGDSPLRAVLLTALLLAADRVDSTTGVQMAYLKSWAPRALRPLALAEPALLPGTGAALRGDALALAATLPAVDLAYLDPPYNHHSYYRNYHVWETLIAWDAPAHYGIACKRADCREGRAYSPFNVRREMPAALAEVIGALRARLLVLSYNDEAWLTLEQLCELCATVRTPSGACSVRSLAFESRRYVGARIGIHDPHGRKVGRVGRLRNLEYLVLAGEPDAVRAAERAVTDEHRIAAAA